MIGRRVPGRIVQGLGGIVDEIDDDLPELLRVDRDLVGGLQVAREIDDVRGNLVVPVSTRPSQTVDRRRRAHGFLLAA